MQFAMVFYAAMGKHNHQKFEHGNESSGVWTLKHLEVLLLAATLLATVIISALTLHQTTQNFQIERTSSFVARFNSLEQVSLREAVDRWLESGESATNLYVRSDPVFFCPSNTTVIVDPTNREDALKTIAQLRTMANFFQEFGTALKFGSLDE